MKIKTFFIPVVFFLLCSLFSTGQGIRNPDAAANEDKFSINYGLRAGYIMKSSISNLGTTILSEPFFINYSMQENPSNGLYAGAYASYRFLNDYLALMGEINYSQQGAELKFNNFEKDFNYTMAFKYQYVNILGMFKIFPLTGIKPKDENYLYGFYLGGGPQLGFNISPDNIVYKSGGSGRLPSFGSDPEQQQQLRNVLKGKTNFGFCFATGYEFKKTGLVLDARCFFGLTDVVETQANSYNFIEEKNTNKTMIQFSIGWDFSFFNKPYQTD